MCNDTTVGGLVGLLRAGTTLSSRLRAGAELGFLHHGYPTGGETLGSATASVSFYPSPTGGLYLKGGLGLSTYHFSGAGGGVRGTGWGAVAGVGYDLRVGRRPWFLTPSADLWYGAIGRLRSGGAPFATGWRQTVLSLGLGVTLP